MRARTRASRMNPAAFRYRLMNSPRRHSAILRSLFGSLAIAPVLGLAAPAAAQVDLVLNISDAPDPVPAGGVVDYVMTVENDELATATGVQLTFGYPAGTSFDGLTGAGVSCSGATVGQAGPATLTCSLPDLASGAAVGLTVQIRTTVAGPVTMAINTTSNEGDVLPGNNGANEGTTVLSGADVALTLGGPARAVSGSTISYTIDLANAGPDPASELEVQFPVPTGFQPSGSLPAGCSLAAGRITCAVSGAIAPGGTRSVGTISGQVGAASTSTITASAFAQVRPGAPVGTPQDPDTNNNEGLLDTAVDPGSDVRISKARSVGGPYFVGDTIDFILTARYTGDPPTGLTITDVIPGQYTIDQANFTLSQNGWSCSVGGSTVTCTRASGGIAGFDQSLGSVSIPVIINTAGTPTNTATISSAGPDPVPGNNTATDGGTVLQDPTADLSISKGGPSPALVVQGQPFDFTLRVSNGGPSDFSGTIVVTDNLPAGLTVDGVTLNGWSCLPAPSVAGPAAIECRRTYLPGSPLAAGAQTPQITLSTRATTTGLLTNQAGVATEGANVPDPVSGNNTTTRSVTSSVSGDAADIQVLKSDSPGTVAAGDLLTYTLELVNNSPIPSNDVVLTDNLATLVSGTGYDGHTINYAGIAPADFTCAYTPSNSTSGQFRCDVVTLPPCSIGSCPTVEIRVRPGGNGGTRNNVASIISNSTADPDLSNNSATEGTTILARADVTVTKSANPDPAPVGQELTYVVTARNNGPSRADGVAIADTLPLDVVFVSASASGGVACADPGTGNVTTAGNRIVSCSWSSINLNAQQTVTIRVKPTSATNTGSGLNNRVGVTTTTTEPDPPGTTNNSAAAEVAIVDPSLDLVVNLTDTVDPVAVLDTTAYVATVTNAGPSDAENVSVVLDLPATGLRYLSSSISAGSCSATPSPGDLDGQLVCSVARLDAGATLTLTVPMTGDTKGVFSASVTASSDETPTFEDPTNNTATENTTVRTRADVEIVSKTASVASIAVRRPFSWTAVVRNNTGPSLAEADTVTVTDMLPPGMELTGPPTAVPTAGTASLTTCSGVAAQTSFTCQLGTMSSGAVVEITIPVRMVSVPASGSSTNAISVSTTSRDIDPTNDADSSAVVVQGSSLSGVVFRDFNDDGAVDGTDTGVVGVQMTIRGQAFDLTPITRTVTTGPGGVWVVDGLPEGTYVVERGAVSEAHLVDGRQTAGDRGGDASVALEISGIGLGEVDTGSGYLFALVPQPRIGLAKRVTSGPTVSSDSSYTATVRLRVQNYSLEALDAVSITDPLAGAAPRFGVFVPGGAAAVLSAGQYTIQTPPSFAAACASGATNAGFDGDATTELATIGTLSPAASCEVDFTLRFHPIVPLPGAGYTNSARVDATGALSSRPVSDLSHDGADPDPSGDGDPGPEQTPTPLTPTLVADVVTAVSFPASVDAGQPVTGAIIFGNDGPYDATSVGYTLTLTPGLTGVTLSNLPAGASATYDPGTGVVTFTGMPSTLQPDQIASGDGLSPIILTYIQNATASTTVSTGISTATSQGANALPDAASTPVGGGLIADVTTQVAFPALVDPGSPVNGTVVFRNDGPSEASDVTYSLTLTPGLVGVSFGNLPGGATATYDPGTGVVTLAGMPAMLLPGQIASGDGVTGVTVTYTQPPSATSDVTSGIGTSTNQGANVAPDTDSATIVGDATVGVAKSGTVTADTVTYDYKLVNVGNAPADSLSLTDDLDAVFGTGNYRVVGPPTVALVPSMGQLRTNTSFTGSAPRVELLDNADPSANTLPPGDSAVVRLKVEVTNLTDRGFGLGIFHNQATVVARGPGGSSTFTDVSSDGSDVDPDGNGDPTDDDSPTIVEFEPHAEIGVAKRAEVDGRRVAFELKIVNTGNAEARAVSLVDDLDPVFGAGNYSVVSAPTFVVDPGTLRLDPNYTGSRPRIDLMDRGNGDDNRLAAGDSAIVRFEVDILTVSDQGFGFGQYRNRASSSSLTFGNEGPFSDDSTDGTDVDPDGNGDPTDDTSPTPISLPVADLGVVKTGPAVAALGDTLTFTIEVSNRGPSPATEVTLRDQLPTGFTFVAASGGGTESGGVVSWPSVAELPAGQAIERTVTVVANAFGSWDNVASATSDTPDPTPEDNDGSHPDNRTTTVVGEGGADLQVEKSGPSVAAIGDTVTYVITTTNLGPEPALDVAVVDDLPSGAVFVDASRGAAAVNQSVQWPLVAVLASGASVVDTVRVVLPTAGVFTNVARASSPTPDPDPTNNDGSNATAQVETETGGIDLAMDKELTSPLVEGGLATWSLRVENRGNRATEGVIEVVDDLPAALEFVSAEGEGWSCTHDAGRVTCTSSAPLAPGSSTVVTLTTRVSAPAGTTVVNGATVTTDGEDPDDDNTDTTVPDDVRPRGELVVEKSASVGTVEVGEIVQYRILVRNRGAGTVGGVSLEDRLPAGFRLVTGSVARNGTSAPDPSGAPGPVLRFELGDLGGGEEIELTYALQVGVGAGLGDGVNRAVATGNDGEETSNTAEAGVTVRQGVFDDEGLIVGRVWVQRHDSVEVSNSSRTEMEVDSVLGVPGVRVYLNDGTSAITDVGGRYSFQGIRPRNWIVRVDERTLPEGMVLEGLTTRHGGEGSNRLVDLTRGEMARADFGDLEVAAPLWQRVLDRVALGPVPEVAVPDRATLRAGTSLGGSPNAAGGWGSRSPRSSNVAVRPGDDPWQARVLERGFGVRPADGASTSDSGDGFRRAGSTSGMLLTPDADRFAGSTAASGVRSEEGRVPEGLLVSGWVEARLDLRSVVAGDLLTSGVRDRFRDALVEISASNDDETLRLGARAAAFATGRLGERTMLTVRFDTEKDAGRRLFADIRPDELYDVLGDASPALFEAQSRGRLFAAVGRDRSYLMYGDFATATYDEARQLGRYNRTLNGVLQHFETDRASVRAFASRDRSRLVVDEFRALGVSGPYTLSRTDGLLNSERVELVTRDRTQPGLILSVEPLQRFTDYTVEPFTGRLVFRRPIASLDDRLNPVSIRVTYEAELGGDRFWVLGADAQVALSDRVTVGGGLVRDDVPNARYDLASANVGMRLGSAGWMRAELAQSDSAGASDGRGLRLETGVQSDWLDLRAQWIQVDSTFSNPSAGLAAGRTEMGLTGLARVGERTSLEAEVLRSVDDRTDRAFDGARLALGRSVAEHWRGALTWRWASADSGATVQPELSSFDVNALGARVEGQLSSRTSVFSEFEQDLSDGDARRLAIGGDYRILERARLYARHELLSSLVGPFGMGSSRDRNATLFGIAAEYREGQSVFSEYRVGDGVAGRGAHAAIGLRNAWQLRDGVRLHTTLERVRPLADVETGDAFSVTGAVEASTSPLWKGSLRGEFRSTAVSDHVFATAGLARKLGERWTALGQSALSRTLDGGAFYERTRLGLAYRGDDRNSWNVLARYEHRTDEDPSAPAGPVDRRAHIVSTHANVRLSPSLVTRAQWALRKSSDRSLGVPIDQTAQLLSGRATLDLTSRFDVGAIGRTHFGDGRRYGLGLEAGLAVSDDLRLSAGYNWFGFRDEELALDEPTDRGFYIGLGWRFDEGLFGMTRVGR